MAKLFGVMPKKIGLPDLVTIVSWLTMLVTKNWWANSGHYLEILGSDSNFLSCWINGGDWTIVDWTTINWLKFLLGDDWTLLVTHYDNQKLTTNFFQSPSLTTRKLNHLVVIFPAPLLL
jgi:hypothetical protein